MARLNLKAVEERVAPLGGRSIYDREFLFELLLAYGRSRNSVTRLRNGSLNLAADKSRDVLQKGVVYFRETDADPLSELDSIKSAPETVRFNPRFIVVTNYDELLAIDTKTRENLIIPISQIDQYFTFFLPWAGMEKAQYTAEAHADVRAAERMGVLYDELLKVNPDILESDERRHGLNVFFTRLLFCFFAEDTEIFPHGLFTESVASLSREDGSDTQELIRSIFRALDTEKPDAKPVHLRRFPYVNGRLFAISDDDVVPSFSPRARKLLTDLGTLQWQEINPDIFGSMFQAIARNERRSELGQHYTSVPNILKTIEPLFLDELREEFNRAANSIPKLRRLLDRISEIKILDPAAGSGNFLVIAYKELRRLEHAILEQIVILENTNHQHQMTMLTKSRINIENFYGIEIDDFAVEVAILSLWIAKHQMNVEFREKFGISIPLIPLRESGSIVAANAARIDWNDVCPNDGETEIYLIGNPPYGGSKIQTAEQKADYPYVFGDRKYSKDLDYVALWFIKGSEYIVGTLAELSFVATNSVAQGQHVSLFFPFVYELGLEIGYAYTSFRWENNAKRNAGVTVVVINLRNPNRKTKYLYTDDIAISVNNINGYLTDASNVCVRRRNKPLSDKLPRMRLGNMPLDNGNLLLNSSERASMLRRFPESKKFIKRFSGSNEFINDIPRFCLWIQDFEVQVAQRLVPLAERIERVEKFRLASPHGGTRKLASRPWSFREQHGSNEDAIIVPSVSSERRDYIPIGYVGPDTVISNLAFAVYDAEPWLFAILTSRMHMAWTRAVGGKMKTDYRYSNTIVYNNFPVPELSDADKERLDEAAFRVLDVREYHSEKTLADLYDPDLMPDNLRQAHQRVDEIVDGLYRKKAFETDEERLALLFDMYEEMTAAEGKANK